MRRVSGSALRLDLLERLARCASRPVAFWHEDREDWLALLLASAELETALEDLAHEGRAVLRAWCDACAETWWRGGQAEWAAQRRALEGLRLPHQLTLKRPEGYAYYALDPRAYGAAAATLGRPGARLRVIGIRSIGSSLAAIVRASLLSQGRRVERVSVRPAGHPWDRKCELGEWLEEVQRDREIDHVVVDEGPGLSGSSFLSVGEALEGAGVAAERITFLTSHVPDPSRLIARDGERRWRRYQARAAVGGVPEAARSEGAVDVSGGRWRPLVFDSEGAWPPCWPEVERKKYLLPASGGLLKFGGLAPYGDAPLERARVLADAGFVPRVARSPGGYHLQSWCEGRVLCRDGSEREPELLARVADYLAFRHRELPATGADPAPLEEMTQVNVAEALGRARPLALCLDVCRPVYADARLCPHEWVRTREGGLMKLDALDHGDDHQFPGPCDAAWDIAGAIIELELSDGAAEAFLRRYERQADDRVARRLTPYLVAYAAERVGRMQMAAVSAAPAERGRLEGAGRRYARRLARFVATLG